MRGPCTCAARPRTKMCSALVRGRPHPAEAPSYERERIRTARPRTNTSASVRTVLVQGRASPSHDETRRTSASSHGRGRLRARATAGSRPEVPAAQKHVGKTVLDESGWLRPPSTAWRARRGIDPALRNPRRELDRGARGHPGSPRDVGPSGPGELARCGVRPPASSPWAGADAVGGQASSEVSGKVRPDRGRLGTEGLERAQ